MPVLVNFGIYCPLLTPLSSCKEFLKYMAAFLTQQHYIERKCLLPKSTYVKVWHTRTNEEHTPKLYYVHRLSQLILVIILILYGKISLFWIHKLSCTNTDKVKQRKRWKRALYKRIFIQIQITYLGFTFLRIQKFHRDVIQVIARKCLYCQCTHWKCT